MIKETKYPNYPELNFVDPKILDFWAESVGPDPDRWDIKAILMIQIIHELRDAGRTDTMVQFKRDIDRSL